MARYRRPPMRYATRARWISALVRRLTEQSSGGELAEWTALINAGKAPDFGANVLD